MLGSLVMSGFCRFVIKSEGTIEAAPVCCDVATENVGWAFWQLFQVHPADMLI